MLCDGVEILLCGDVKFSGMMRFREVSMVVVRVVVISAVRALSDRSIGAGQFYETVVVEGQLELRLGGALVVVERRGSSSGAGSFENRVTPITSLSRDSWEHRMAGKILPSCKVFLGMGKLSRTSVLEEVSRYCPKTLGVSSIVLLQARQLKGALTIGIQHSVRFH